MKVQMMSNKDTIKYLKEEAEARERDEWEQQQEAEAREAGFADLLALCKDHVDSQSPAAEPEARQRMAEELRAIVVNKFESIPRAWLELR